MDLSLVYVEYMKTNGGTLNQLLLLVGSALR